MQEQIKEILKAIKEDRLYDYIANHYWEIDRELLKDLILEIFYTLRIERTLESEEDIEWLSNNLICKLEENRGWER